MAEMLVHVRVGVNVPVQIGVEGGTVVAVREGVSLRIQLGVAVISVGSGGAGEGVQEEFKVAVFVGMTVREGVGVFVHVGRTKVPVALAASVAVIVAVDDGRAVILAVLDAVGVFVEVGVFEGVGETISIVAEEILSSRTGCGVQLGGRGIAVSRRS